MQSYEQATKSAREKLLVAERALDAYLHTRKCDPETLRQLSIAASAARREVLDLLADLCPGSDTQAITPEPLPQTPPFRTP